MSDMKPSELLAALDPKRRLPNETVGVWMTDAERDGLRAYIRAAEAREERVRGVVKMLQTILRTDSAREVERLTTECLRQLGAEPPALHGCLYCEGRGCVVCAETTNANVVFLRVAEGGQAIIKDHAVRDQADALSPQEPSHE